MYDDPVKSTPVAVNGGRSGVLDFGKGAEIGFSLMSLACSATIQKALNILPGCWDPIFLPDRNYSAVDTSMVQFNVCTENNN